MVQIKWTKLEKEIYTYISRDSATYAKIQILRLRVRVEILMTNPLSGKLIPEYNDSRYRELIEGNYRIIYKLIDKNRIDILTIHHSARELQRRPIK